jgi:hypothetical protein
VAFAVANDHNGLETGSLTGTGLLLDGFDLAKTSLDSGTRCILYIVRNASRGAVVLPS